MIYKTHRENIKKDNKVKQLLHVLVLRTVFILEVCTYVIKTLRFPAFVIK